MSEVERSESKATSSKDSGWTDARTLNTPEARRYCEWSLLVNDLKYALRRAKMWRDMVPSDAGDVGDIEISVSLFRDAVVSLVACFDDTSPVYLVPGVLQVHVVNSTSSVRRATQQCAQQSCRRKDSA